MSCTFGLPLDCTAPSGQGGASRKVWLLPAAAATGPITYDIYGRITSIQLAQKFIQYAVDVDSIGYTEDWQPLTRTRRIQLDMQVVQITAERMAAIRGLIRQPVIVLLTDRNSRWWLVGYPFGLRAATATASTGKTSTDYNGQSISLQGQAICAAVQIAPDAVEAIQDQLEDPCETLAALYGGDVYEYTSMLPYIDCPVELWNIGKILP